MIDGVAGYLSALQQADGGFGGADIEAVKQGRAALSALVRALEAEARNAGAKQFLMVGHSVENKDLLRLFIPLAKRFGYRVRMIGEDTFELFKELV